MSWAYTKSTQEGHAFGLKVVCGTFSNVSSGTGGIIYTGLKTVVSLALSSNSTTNPYCTDTPANGVLKASDGVTIVTGSTDYGTWIACGL